MLNILVLVGAANTSQIKCYNANSPDKSLNTNVSLQNYVIKQTPTESTAGGALLYINKRHSYKTHPDLAIYKPKNLNQFLLKLFYPRKAT